LHEPPLPLRFDATKLKIWLLGGGAFAVIPLGERGKLPDLIPLFKGHSGPVLDTDFNPFNDRVLASGSDDCKVCFKLAISKTY